MGYRRQRTGDPFRPILYLPTAPITGMLLTVAALCAATWSMPPQAVLIDLPGPMPPNFPPHFHPSNTVSVTADNEIHWNEIPVSVQGLLERLAETRTTPTQPVLIYDPTSDASYDLSAKVLWVIKSAGYADEFFCFGHLETYRDFDRPLSALPAIPPSTECHPELIIPVD